MIKTGTIYVNKTDLSEYRYGDDFTCEGGHTRSPSAAVLEQEGFVLPATPAYDETTHYLPVTDKFEIVSGVVIHRVVAFTTEELASNEEENAQLEADIIAGNVAMLWRAAHDYEYSQVSGTAVGMVTIGIIQGLPKCLAVSAWCSTIWTLYYVRKAEVVAGGSADLDFSWCGEIPYSVPELMVETGTVV